MVLLQDLSGLRNGQASDAFRKECHKGRATGVLVELFRARGELPSERLKVAEALGGCLRGWRFGSPHAFQVTNVWSRWLNDFANDVSVFR